MDSKSKKLDGQQSEELDGQQIEKNADVPVKKLFTEATSLALAKFATEAFLHKIVQTVA